MRYDPDPGPLYYEFAKLLSGYCVRYLVRCFGHENYITSEKKEETLCTRKTTLSDLLILSEEKNYLHLQQTDLKPVEKKPAPKVRFFVNIRFNDHG
jgi:hypothetical protein